MSKSPIGEHLQRDLENALKTEEFKKAFEEMKTGKEVFQKYPTVEVLCALAGPGKQGDYGAKDAVLAVLLARVRQERAIFPLLHLMFWESLERLFLRKRRSVADPEELFARIHTEFYYVATSYPLERRPRKIDVNLVLDTRQRIILWQQSEARRRSRCGWLPDDHAGGIPLSSFRESPVFPEEMVEYLLDLVYRKVITEQQYDLLLETQVYRRMSQKTWAAARGVPHATARIWHNRAGLAVREYERERKMKK